MAKSRYNEGNEFTFEQLELAMESAIGLENDERNARDVNEPSTRRYARSSNVMIGQHRNRNHYNHYCNVHHQHHHHHHHQHHYHHHNRGNTYFCQQEMSTSGDEQYFALDQPEFEEIWRDLDNDKDRYNFLKSLHRASPQGNLVFSEMSLGSLGDMASALSEFDDTVDDFCFVIYILNALSRAKRFLLSLQFLNGDERQECKKLFHKLWRSMSDKQQDLAENNITELTINELMKLYEIE